MISSKVQQLPPRYVSFRFTLYPPTGVHVCAVCGSVCFYLHHFPLPACDKPVFVVTVCVVNVWREPVCLSKSAHIRGENCEKWTVGVELPALSQEGIPELDLDGSFFPI